VGGKMPKCKSAVILWVSRLHGLPKCKSAFISPGFRPFGGFSEK
jgi:hypothetical protein